VFGIDKHRRSSGFLRLRYHLQRHGGFAGRLGPKDLDHPSAREAAHAQRRIHRNRTAGYYGHRQNAARAEAQHRAFAELLVHLAEGGVDSALARGGVD
jgi:hypothetical protein